MSVTLSVEGEKELRNALRFLNKRAQRHVDNAINATGLSLRGEIVKKYQRGPATGEVYKKFDPKRTHRASAPGEAPATDTGRLANSVVTDKPRNLEIDVLTTVKYGPWLEFGTQRIEPRPNWVPSVEDERPKYRRRLINALRKAAEE